MPKRIQRRRVKGWRMPPNTVYVGRPTKWGNPYRVGQDIVDFGKWEIRRATRRDVVDLFRRVLMQPEAEMFRREIRTHLRGKNLCCWCPLDKPCHADLLLEIANQ